MSDYRSFASNPYNNKRPDDQSESTKESMYRSTQAATYTFKKLREFMTQKKYFVQRQFVADGNVVFIKIHVESIGENILVYFPSKYNVPVEVNNVPTTEVVPYEITDKDLLCLKKHDDNDTKNNYSELAVDELKNMNNYEDNYEAINMESNKDTIVVKKMVKYNNQLDKFKNCTPKISYKFAILTDDVLCIINRHNDTENYLIKNGKGLVPNIIDSKTDSVCQIDHELYVLIDLPSFYEKIDQLPDDLIRLYKNFYATLSKAHTTQTSIVEHRFKNYQQLVTKMMAEYANKNKFLDLMSSLTTSLTKTIKQEKELVEKINIIEASRNSATVSKDTDISFKLSKNESDLAKVREVKLKTTTLLREVKTKYHAYILTFDSVITETASDLKNVESNMELLGISTVKK